MARSKLQATSHESQVKSYELQVPPEYRNGACGHAWCAIFDRWFSDYNSKFYAMWGEAWHLRERGNAACWNWRGGAQFFDQTLAGATCDRNWLQGAVGGRNDRPFASPSPALLSMR